MGWILLFIVLAGTMNATFQELKVAGNRASQMSIDVRNTLMTMFPNETFSFYDWKYDTTTDSLPIVLYLDAQGLSSDTGRRIGVIRPQEKLKFNIPAIATFSSTLVDLSVFDRSQLIQSGWHDVNPNAIYHETEEWQE
jgi:hypothetical protein